MLSARGVILLEGAIGYAIDSAKAVEPAQLGRRTPCADWDLHDLLIHATDSLAVLSDTLSTGKIAMSAPLPEETASGVPAAFCGQGRALLKLLAETDTKCDQVAVGEEPLFLDADVVANALALEISVHGWDISRASGHNRAIPATLAAEMLSTVTLVVTDNIRPQLFAPAVAASPQAGPSDLLVAFLGRDPDR